MTRTRGAGPLIAWTDIDPESESEFNRWYDEQQIPLLLQTSGFLSAGAMSRSRVSRNI